MAAGYSSSSKEGSKAGSKKGANSSESEVDSKGRPRMTGDDGRVTALNMTAYNSDGSMVSFNTADGKKSSV